MLAVDHPLVHAQDVAALKAKILAFGLSTSQLVAVAWASASTFRGSDQRGGKHGIFTQRTDELTNDFFVNLRNMNTKWQRSLDTDFVPEGRGRKTDERKLTGTVADLDG